LSRKLEEEYQKIKDAKRTDILKKDMVMDEDEKKKDCIDKAIDLLEAGEVRDTRELTGMGLMEGIQGRSFVDKVRRRLEKYKKPTALTGYFWDTNSNRKNKDPMNMFKD
jgi:hydrogenase maturation factor HypF (carbamoyltransferase family)